jgi:hypothetical protein
MPIAVDCNTIVAHSLSNSVDEARKHSHTHTQLTHSKAPKDFLGYQSNKHLDSVSQLGGSNTLELGYYSAMLLTPQERTSEFGSVEEGMLHTSHDDENLTASYRDRERNAVDFSLRDNGCGIREI